MAGQHQLGKRTTISTVSGSLLSLWASEHPSPKVNWVAKVSGIQPQKVVQHEKPLWEGNFLSLLRGSMARKSSFFLSSQVALKGLGGVPVTPKKPDKPKEHHKSFKN